MLIQIDNTSAIAAVNKMGSAKSEFVDQDVLSTGHHPKTK